MNPPAALQTEIEIMSHAIRTSKHCQATPGIDHYRSCIRENISDVLTTTYILACRHLSTQTQTRLVDDFIDLHSAQSPEFHHIATELLVFVTDTNLLPTKLKKLMEYEWLLLTLEIDPVDIAKTSALNPKDTLENRQITSNPTLSCIQLPFSLPLPDIEEESLSEAPSAIHFYMICRDHEHDIIYKEMSDIDSVIIPQLSQSKTMTWKEVYSLQQAKFSKTALNEWLRHTHEMQFITISHQEVAC